MAKAAWVVTGFFLFCMFPLRHSRRLPCHQFPSGSAILIRAVRFGFPHIFGCCDGLPSGFFFRFDIHNANPVGAKLGAPKALTVLLSQLSPMGLVAVVAVCLRLPFGGY